MSDLTWVQLDLFGGGTRYRKFGGKVTMIDEKRVPTRFQAPCELCDDIIDTRKPGNYQFTSGWVRIRNEGGGNAIALAERELRFACSLCIERRRHGVSTKQMTLLD